VNEKIRRLMGSGPAICRPGRLSPALPSHQPKGDDSLASLSPENQAQHEARILALMARVEADMAEIGEREERAARRAERLRATRHRRSHGKT
jgi:hypothetical protein